MNRAFVLFDWSTDREERLWYARKTVENGWNRSASIIPIERELFEAQGAASTNCETTLPAPAQGTLKDPSKLDSLGISDGAGERVNELGLVRHTGDSRPVSAGPDAPSSRLQ